MVKHIPPPRRAVPDSPAPLGEFEQLVLFALARLGDGTYGAAIRRDIETRTGRDLSISAVYVTLDRLEKKGFVRFTIGEPTAERGGRRRKLVDLLPAGAQTAAHAFHTLRVMTEGLEQRFRTP